LELLAFDQIINNAAKTLSQSAGDFKCPIVFRGPSGAAGQLAQQHSQTFESWLANCPGLKVISCIDPLDSKALLKAAIRDEDPVCVMESELMYGMLQAEGANGRKQYIMKKQVIAETDEAAFPYGEDHVLPIGKAAVRKSGTDVTLVTYNKMLIPTLQAAVELQKEGISAEVIDLRTIRPLDHQTIIDSVRKTNRLVVIDESWPFAGVSSEVAYIAQKYAFDYLDAPVIRVNSADTSLPFAPTLVDEYLPNPDKIIRAVKEVAYVS